MVRKYAVYDFNPMTFIVLCPSMWSISVNISNELEENVFSAVVGWCVLLLLIS